MTKTEVIRARITHDLKEDCEIILKELGLTTTQAITLFFSQIKIHKGLPFNVKIPNNTTLKTLKNTDEGKELHEYKNLNEFFNKMNSK